jgi:hypothetical protein
MFSKITYLVFSLILIVDMNCQQRFRGNDFDIEGIWITRSNERNRNRNEEVKEIGQLPLRNPRLKNEFANEDINYILGKFYIYFTNHT